MRLYATLFAIVYVLMILTAFILPEFSAEGYSRVEHSLSELGAQETPNNWIMNLVFMLLGIVTVLLGTKVLRQFWLPLYLLYFFAAAMFFTGVFQHGHINEVVFFEGEHMAHSVFSMITGTAFCAYSIAVSFFLKRIERASAILLCCLAIGLSLLMLQFDHLRGIFQRILFITAFGWLFYSLVSFKYEKPEGKT